MTDKYRPIAIRVEDLWVVKGGGAFTGRAAKLALLQGAGFSVEPGSFVGIVGPNGAGKTTMFKALVGDKPYSGQILLTQEHDVQGGASGYESLYDNPEYWLQQIGYVPVDNVLHEDLTVRQSLLHSGRLRLPGVSDEEIERRFMNALIVLGFEERDSRMDRQIRMLSSGERKKVNVAAELLTNPPLLLLDEPTSNLDPNAERDLMDSLRRLSGKQNNGDGPTVLLITHTLETLDRCDQVVFIANSKLLTEGSADAVFQWLEDDLSKRGLAPATSSDKFEHWATIFDEHKTDEKRAERRTIPLPALKEHPQAARREVRNDSFWRQFGILSSRYFLGRYNDLGGIFTILFSAFVAGFLLLIAPSEVFLKARDASAARQTVVLFVILVVITGAFNSHREISKEFRIYIHERAKGLNPLAYLISKTLWLAVVLGALGSLTMLALTGMPIARVAVLLAGVLLLGIGIGTLFVNKALRKMSAAARLRRVARMAIIVSPLFLSAFVQLQGKELPTSPLAPSLVEISIIITLTLGSIAALSAGLMVSAFVGGNNDRATQLVIAIIIANVILAFSVLVVSSPQFRPLFQTLEPFTATHWGYNGFASSLGIYCWAGSLKFNDFNSAGHIADTWLYLIVQIFVCIGLAVLALRLQETWVSRQRVLVSLVRQRWTWVYTLAVLLVLSWAAYLSNQSYSYYALTFSDELEGRNRYANINLVSNTTFMQQLNGKLSESACVYQNSADNKPDDNAQTNAVSMSIMSAEDN